MTSDTTTACPCGNAFKSEDDLSHFWQEIDTFECDQCSAIAEAEETRIRQDRAQQELASARLRITEITPCRYQQTDTAHPAFNRDLWNMVKTWRPTAQTPFLGLVGESGASKTRIGFLLLRDIIESSMAINQVSNKRFRTPTFAAVSSPELAQIVARQFTPSEWGGLSGDSPQTKARCRLDFIKKCDVFLLDDMGKARHTPAVAAELFAIIDHRHAHNLTTLWTANSSPEQIVAGMPEDMAGPLAGRLIECSKILIA